MPRYSLRQVLSAVSALCVALALAQLEFVSSCVCFVAFLVVLHFLVAVRIWRCIAYGAILGIIGGFLVMMLFIRFRLGYSTPSNYQESFAIEGILQAWRSYVVHLGAYGGALLALWIRGGKGGARE
jgi:hypothetical protein